MTKTKEHHIFRIGKGWQVKVVIDGTQKTKFFSDSKFGGKDGALEAAIERRKVMLEERGEIHQGRDHYEKRFYYPNGTGRGTTGIAGIYLSTEEGAQGKSLSFSTTIVIEEGDVMSRSRSISKWGFASALDQVAQIRKKWMKKIYPDRFDEAEFDKKVEKLKDNKESFLMNH